MRGQAILALAGMNLIWGALFPIVKPALEMIPPYTFTLFRFLVAMAVLLPLARKDILPLLRSPDKWRIVLLGLLGLCLAQVTQTLALKLSTASDIALLSMAAPLWIVVLARRWLSERLNWLKGLGFIIAVIGILLILWPQESGGPWLSQRILGDAIVMITGFCWACYNVIGKKMMERYKPLAVTATAGIFGTLAIIPFATWEVLSGQTAEFTLVSVGAVLYAGLLVTALGFVVLFWALSRIRATQAGIMMYLQPVAGTLIAWSLLNEQLSSMFIIGGLLILAGVYVVTRGETHNK